MLSKREFKMTATNGSIANSVSQPTYKPKVHQDSYDGNPRVGVRMGARHEDGRYTDIFVSRYPCPLDAGGFNEPNKTVVK